MIKSTNWPFGDLVDEDIYIQLSFIIFFKKDKLDH